jgi:hypothetical protein
MELHLEVVKALLCTLDVSVGTSVFFWLQFEMCFRPARGQESGLDVSFHLYTCHIPSHVRHCQTFGTLRDGFGKLV